MAKTLKFSELIDCRIKFTTSDGMFEGDVKTVSNSFEKMILQNCVFLHDNIPVGTLFLLFKEVSDVEVINQSRLKNISSLRKRSVYFNGGAKSSEITTEDFNIPPSFGHLPLRIFTISSIGEEFKRSIDDLRMSPVIGISLEGLKIGRFGLVNWLCASSRTGTYLFDLQVLGRKVFDFGLRKILESSVTEKVIHDCRQVSDALYHLYNTKLSRVFDTQTAEAFVNLQINSGDFHGYVNSLDICLQRHLDITKDYLLQPAKNISYPLKVKSSLIRPPGHHEMSIMVKNVIYLRSLRDELKKKMLNPFRGGVETHLKAVASKSGLELRLKPHDPIRIPGELIVEDKFRAVEYKETPHIPIDEVFNLPYTGQYSIVNKLNEIRKQNPHSNAEDIQAKLPKVSTRRGPYHYLEPVCILDVESRSHSGKTTSDELKPRSPSNSVGVFVPEKNMALPGGRSTVSKTGTSKHSTSSVSLVKKELSSGSKLPLSNHSALEIKDSQSGSSIKNNMVLLGEKVSSTEAETSKQTSVRIGYSRVLAYLRQNGVLIDSCSPSETKSSHVNHPDERVPSKDKENHCFEASSVPRCEKEGKTNQDSSDTSQYEMSDYNTVQYNRDGTFCFLPRKNVSSTSDSSDPWAALKSNYYPEHDSVGNHHALKHKFVPAGAE